MNSKKLLKHENPPYMGACMGMLTMKKLGEKSDVTRNVVSSQMKVKKI